MPSLLAAQMRRVHLRHRHRHQPTDVKESHCSLSNATDCYAGPFGTRFIEQCWADRWRDMTSAATLQPLASTDASATSSMRLLCNRGLACAARLAGKPICMRRPPLLLNATRDVVSFTHAAPLLKRSLRYFTAIDCDAPQDGNSSTSRPITTVSSSSSTSAAFKPSTDSSDHVCLIFKNDVQEAWVGGLSSHDGLTFVGEPKLVYPKHAKKWPKNAQGVMTHNFAIARHGSAAGSGATT